MIIICKKKCKICIKNYEIIVDLNNTNTAEKIWENLPITSNVNVWGEEIYFYIPVSAEIERDAKAVITLVRLFIGLMVKQLQLVLGKHLFH